MTRFQIAIAVSALLAAGCSHHGRAMHRDATKVNQQSAATLATAKAFLGAVGAGDMTTLSALMTDDFVWHNEGDQRVPWIGTWDGKDTVFNTFFPAFGGGLKTTSWTTDYSFASGNQAVFMGTMNADATNTGTSTGEMSWAVRVHVEDGKVKSWNWFEDSYAVSRAYNAK